MHLLNLSNSSPAVSPLFRIPQSHSPVFSFEKPVILNLRENFKSLIAGAGQSLHTPLKLFTYIPSQHIQLNLGLLKTLGFQTQAWKCLSQVALQQFQSAPFVQSLFQNLIAQGSMPSSTLNSSSAASPLEANLQAKILNPEPAVAAKVQELNQKRAQKGQAPIDFSATTRKIEGIMNNPALSDKQKKSQIADLRKHLGLGKKDMRTLFTQRLKSIYQDSANQIRTQLQSTTDPIERQKLESQLQSYESKSKLYGSMFKSFWSKLGGAFQKIGGFFKKVGSSFLKVVSFVSPVLKLIPSLVKNGLQKFIQAF